VAFLVVFLFRPNVVPGVSTRCPNSTFPDANLMQPRFQIPGDGVFWQCSPQLFARAWFCSGRFFRIFKNTRLTENTALQLRVEIFNLFNKANFADPSAVWFGAITTRCGQRQFFGQSISTVGNQLAIARFRRPASIQLSRDTSSERTCESGESIKPGAWAPGSGPNTNVSPRSGRQPRRNFETVGVGIVILSFARVAGSWF